METQACHGVSLCLWHDLLKAPLFFYEAGMIAGPLSQCTRDGERCSQHTDSTEIALVIHLLPNHGLQWTMLKINSAFSEP